MQHCSTLRPGAPEVCPLWFVVYYKTLDQAPERSIPFLTPWPSHQVFSKIDKGFKQCTASVQLPSADAPSVVIPVVCLEFRGELLTRPSQVLRPVPPLGVRPHRLVSRARRRGQNCTTALDQPQGPALLAVTFHLRLGLALSSRPLRSKASTPVVLAG